MSDDLGLVFFGLLFAVSLAPYALRGAGYTRRQRPRGTVRRATAYGVTAGALLAIGALALALDLAGARRGVRLALAVPNLDALLPWTFFATLVGLAIWTTPQRIVRTPARLGLLPRNARERALLLFAAAVEEYVFRGYLLALMLSVMIRSPFIPIALVTFCFALFHGPRVESVVRYLLLAVVLVVPILATGSLLPSIVARVVVESVSLVRSAGSSTQVGPTR